MNGHSRNSNSLLFQQSMKIRDTNKSMNLSDNISKQSLGIVYKTQIFPHTSNVHISRPLTVPVAQTMIEIIRFLAFQLLACRHALVVNITAVFSHLFIFKLMSKSENFCLCRFRALFEFESAQSMRSKTLSRTTQYSNSCGKSKIGENVMVLSSF